MTSPCRAHKVWLMSAVFLSPLVGIALWVLLMRVSGNIHTVEEGILYRSGQLSGARLSDTIQTYGIRSVINLRGPNPDRGWYRDERAVSNALNIPHFDLPLSANREPEDARLQHLVRLLREAPKPVLVHCEAGSDRSGLASALYKLAVAGRPPEEAGKQLSLWYGHFPWLFSRTGAMDRAFSRFSQQHQ
jgi:protein tyrosine/serine phosphatase